MTQTLVIQIGREALVTVLLLAGPAMAVALIIGLVISILQATTQVQDQMLNLAPKIAGVFVTLLILGAWLLNTAVNFTSRLYARIPDIIR